MDFGEPGAGAVTLSWRSRLPENSIRIDFESESGITTQMITLPQAESYAEARFSLSERIFGLNKVRLVFLPGCSLDLGWIEFTNL
jgi:beta-galactosidase